MAIRVLIADDSDIMRRGLETYLRDWPAVKVVGSTNTIEETNKAIAELKPDVVLLDLHIDLRKSLQPGNARLIVLTFGLNEWHAELAKGLGTCVFIDKGDLTEKLLPAILQGTEQSFS